MTLEKDQEPKAVDRYHLVYAMIFSLRNKKLDQMNDGEKALKSVLFYTPFSIAYLPCAHLIMNQMFRMVMIVRVSSNVNRLPLRTNPYITDSTFPRRIDSTTYSTSEIPISDDADDDVAMQKKTQVFFSDKDTFSFYVSAFVVF